MPFKSMALLYRKFTGSLAPATLGGKPQRVPGPSGSLWPVPQAQ